MQLLPCGADVTCHVIKKLIFFKSFENYFLKLKKSENKFKNPEKKLLKLNFRLLIFFNLKIIFFSSFFSKNHFQKFQIL